jgi:hypothetical protein
MEVFGMEVFGRYAQRQMPLLSSPRRARPSPHEAGSATEELYATDLTIAACQHVITEQAVPMLRRPNLKDGRLEDRCKCQR